MNRVLDALRQIAVCWHASSTRQHSAHRMVRFETEFEILRRFSMRTLRKEKLLITLTTLAFGLNGFAQNASLPSTSPDEYDVPKYQAIYQDAAQKLQNAQGLLQNLDQRLARANAVAQQEREKLADIDQKIRRNERGIRESQERMDRLHEEGRQAQQEMNQIERNLPELEKDIRAEEAKRDSLTKQHRSAQQNAERLEAVAKQKEAVIQPLRQAVETKRQAVAKLQGEVNELKTKAQALQTERDGLNATIAAKQGRVNALPGEIQQAIAEVARTKAVHTAAVAEFDRLNTVAANLEQEASRQPRNRELRQRAIQARNAAKVAQKNAEVARARTVDAANKEKSLKEEQAGIAAAVTEAQTKLTSVKQRLQEANQQLNPAKVNLEATEKELAVAKAELDRASPEANQARQEANQAREVAKTVKGVLEETEQKLSRKTERGKELRHRFSQLQKSIQDNRQASQNERNRIAEFSNDNQQLTRRFNRQVEVVQQADYEVQLSVRDRDHAAIVVQGAEEDAAAAASRLAQVESNLRAGIAIATEDGRADGSGDGVREGTRQGSSAGARDGQETGKREGREKGTAEGIAQARASGKEEGSRIGEAEGTRKGLEDGKAKGLAEGRERGRAEGLAAGYEAGFAEGDSTGYKDGIASGKASGAYEKGRVEGFAQGADRATREGTDKGQRDGYAKAEEEFMNAELSDQVLSNRSSSNRGAPVSRLFGSTGWENRNPRRTYPHPVLDDTYNRIYDESFTTSAGQAYERTYAENYSAAYDKAYGPAFEDYLNRDYSKEFTAAKKEAQKAAFDAAYDTNSKAAYAEAFGPAFDNAYSAALPERKAEGKRDGHKIGFERGKSEAVASELARGKADGNRQGFEQTYPKAYSAAEEKGHAQGVDFFTRNAVLAFDGGVPVDANDDGVFAPGEAVFLTVAVKNFGKASQRKPVEVNLSAISGELTVENAKDVLVPLPGQTRSVVTLVGGLRISPKAQPGSRMSAQMSVVHDGKVMGKTTLTFTVGFPYGIASLEAPGYAMPEQQNEIRVQVRNGSSKASASDVSVRLIAVDGAARIGSPESVILGKLESGESKAASFVFTFSEADAFKAMRFELQILEGAWVLGRREFAVNSAKRWTFRPEANGLLVIGSGDVAKRSESAAALAGLSYDLWDIRVEGQLTSEVLLKYAGKSVIVPAFHAAQDEFTARALVEFMDAGGNLFSGPVDTRTAAGALVSRYAQNVETTSLDGLRVSQANQFKAGAPKYMIAISDSDLNSAQTLAERLVTFEVMGRDMPGKVTTALAFENAGNASLAQVARHAILRDLLKEMFDDKAVDGDAFKNRKEQLQLTAFVNTILAKPAKERASLVQLYPELEKARKKLGSIFNRRRAHVKKVLKPLKKAFQAISG